MRKPPKRKKGQGKGKRLFNGIVLDVSTTAAFLGCSEKTLRARISRRVVPFRKDNGRIVFLKKELEDFLNALPGVSADEARQNMEGRQ